MKRYPLDLKAKVLSEYCQGTCGYKLLAKKYGLKRDTVREWVLAKRKKDEALKEKEATMEESPAAEDVKATEE